jgi:hypothetical protein
MNQIAIGIRYNQKVNLIGFQWPKLSTLKAMARYEAGRLKRKVARAVDRIAMAFNPMPAAALA